MESVFIKLENRVKSLANSLREYPLETVLGDSGSNPAPSVLGFIS